MAVMSADVRRWVLPGLAAVVVVVLMWLLASLLDPSSDPAAGSRGDFAPVQGPVVVRPTPTVLLPGSTGGGAG